MTCAGDTYEISEHREAMFVWRPIVQGAQTPVAQSSEDRFWSSCVVDIDTTGDANLIGTIVRVFAVNAGFDVLMTTQVVAAQDKLRIASVLGQGARRWKVTVEGNGAGPPNPSREVPISVLCFGKDP